MMSENPTERKGSKIETVSDALLYNLDPYSVPIVEAVNLAVVFEDFGDQLDVLGRSISGPEIELRSKPSIDLDRDKHRPLLDLGGRDKSITPQEGEEEDEEEAEEEVRYLLKQRYESVIPQRVRQGFEGPATRLKRRLSDAIRDSYLNTLTTNGKLQVDRAFLQKTVQDVMIDIIQKSSFECLLDTIEDDKKKKEEMLHSFKKSLGDAKYIKSTRRAIKQARREKVTESNNLDRVIWQLEDHSQELTIRTKMEATYVTNYGNLIRKRSKKVCKKDEKVVQDELEDIRMDLLEEFRVHSSMMEAIQSRFSKLREKLEYWLEKYEVDKENLQTELDTMKENRARDLEQMTWLRHMIYNYSQVCKDNRRIRAKEEARIQRSELEIKKSIKIQAWWRGTMVRNELGPYRPVKEKKSKDKDGKKGKKK